MKTVFTVAESPVQHAPRSHRRESSELTEVKRMQHDAYFKAMDTALSDNDRRSWMRTYAELSERRRILQNKPLPGSLKPELMRGRKKPHLLNAASLMAMHDASVAEQPAQPAHEAPIAAPTP